MAKERGLGRGLESIFGSGSTKKEGKPHYRTLADSIREEKSRKEKTGEGKEERSELLRESKAEKENAVEKDKTRTGAEKAESLGRNTGAKGAETAGAEENDGRTGEHGAEQHRTGSISETGRTEEVKTENAPAERNEENRNNEENVGTGEHTGTGAPTLSIGRAEERNEAFKSSDADLKKLPGVVGIENGSVLVRLSRIQPRKDQPRKDFDEEKLQELADSIKSYGIISPIVVKQTGPFYEIVAGERRWRAARLAGLEAVPVVVKDVDQRTGREMAIIENIQRADLNAVEEALAYQSLIEEYGLTQEEVASRVSKNRSTITNSLRLLKLDEELLLMLREGSLTQGHARALLPIEDKALRRKIAEKCAKENLSVREIETLVKLDKLSKEKKEKKHSPEAEEMKRLKTIYKDLERRMKAKLGTKVTIVPKNKDKGSLTIEYYSQEELDRIFLILNSSRD